ncbi:hypothetical protein SISSUDRAFT_1055046 [Sistotremastrum suecicum HHB10207 ss-3]|uniref:Uncharacterized protein n=1 Tax=Sistotremastrum suecicum HHB10207 ss-3 TaxID=1314776 RepID=A0A165Y350_9AGAM|nr:hypothetical protein SISSUDRAFT_1055046 [Sistotremastrum suecicum HHB10207 ss-3]
MESGTQSWEQGSENTQGETIYLRTFVSSDRTKDIADFFHGSALSLARDFAIDVGPLRLLSQAGFNVQISFTISHDQPLTVYYFAFPLHPDGSWPGHPGLWSLCPYPLCSDCRLHADAAQFGFHVAPFVKYERIDNRILFVLQDLKLHAFFPISDITYASNPPFATISEVSDQRAPESIIAPRGKKRRAKDLLSIFSKKRKVTNS